VKVLQAIPWDIDEEDEDDDEIVRYQGRSATLVKHSGRTLTVEFDPHEKLPGLHEVDITDVRA
jgi:hypothetical protein